MKKLLFKILDEIGIYTQGDRLLRKERRNTARLSKAKKVADTMSKENNRRYYVLAASFSLPFPRVGKYYIISTHEINQARRKRYLKPQCNAKWLFENAEYFTK